MGEPPDASVMVAGRLSAFRDCHVPPTNAKRSAVFIAEEKTVERIERMTRELMPKMHATGHPFIVGSECDVLSVPGAHTATETKLAALMNCATCVAV